MKGATATATLIDIGDGVSIHAPMKGATNATIQGTDKFISFNPRTHEGCDFKVWVFFQSFIVSIHAPMKGATDIAKQKRNQKGVSIHAPMKGATRDGLGLLYTMDEFQSTHP